MPLAALAGHDGGFLNLVCSELGGGFGKCGGEFVWFDKTFDELWKYSFVYNLHFLEGANQTNHFKPFVLASEELLFEGSLPNMALISS